MDTNSYYTYLQGKGMNGADFVLNNSNLTPALREQQIKFQQQLLHLKQQQQLQQSLLFQHFQQQQQQLVQHHEKQLHESFKEYLHRQKLEQQQIEQEIKEKENLDAVRKKEKREQSAVASNEVKQRLLEFVLSKKQREAVIKSVSNSPTESKKWHVFLGKYNDNFPFRKTENGSTEPDFGFGSPQGYISSQNLSQATSNSSFDYENPGRPSYPTPTNGLNLHPSPSLPNISLGRPPAYFTDESKSAISDTQSKTSITAQLGLPLTPQSLHSSLPFYPPLPVTDGEFASPTNPVYIQHQMKALEQASSSRPDISVSDVMPVVSRACYPTSGITKAVEAQARLYRNSSRPLGRTQSAPLPLGHPLLQPQGMVLSTSQGESFLRDQQHNLLRQHIRQTVLTRTSSKNQVENVEEETEAAIAQEMKDSSCDKKSFISIEAIDLSEPKSKVDRDKPDVGHITVTKKNYLEMLNGSAFTSHNHHVTRPLSRALSSPLVNLNPTGNIHEKFVYTHHAFTTGLVYDSLMLKHQCTCGDNTHHPEHGGRLQSVWARLHETGLVARCEKVKARKASLGEIQSCHSEAYSILFGTNPLNRQKLDLSKLDLPLKNFVKLPCGGIGVDFDTVWNELHTADAARMAAGCVTELSFKVATGEVKNGFAVVRPPGHHAESQQAMGFCYFNSLAIAARQLQQKLKLEKILIVDWDIHHGNGLQQIFYNDPQVLYISLHRHDDGNFFPGTGGLEEVGTGDGIGYNVNIPWAGGLDPSLGDAEYIAAFRTIVMPIAEEFNPEIVLVAAGFDAAQGHPHQLGGYTVSPACFGYLTKQLMQLAKGKLVMALEGGYDLTAVCDCSQVCVSTLLGENNCSLKTEDVIRQPQWVAVEVLQQVISTQASYWPSIKQSVHGCSLLETKKKESGLEITRTTVPSVFVAAEQNQIQKTVVNESMDVDHK